MSEVADSRELSLEVLMEILEKGRPSHMVLRQALEKYQYLPRPERALVTRLTEGTLEYLIQIDYILNQYSKVPVPKMKPVIRTILRMSVYQIMYLDRIPHSAACNEAVKLAVKRRFSGLKGFVNGVLRNIAREKDTIRKSLPDLSVRYSVPSWIIDMWNKELGSEQTEEILKAFLQERPLTVRCNFSLAGKEEILASLKAQNVLAEASPYADSVLLLKSYDYLEALEAFQRGWIQVQDLSSVFAGIAASPKAGSFVLDVCGAPGGKSLHAADLLKGTGMVETRDLTEYKIGLIQENILRTGFSNIRTKVWDALTLDETMIEKADVLFADLPCSGLGILGKKPDIKLHMTKENANELAKLQRQILSVVWQYVKPGGTLLYSTCTIHQAENQENAEWFMEHYPFEPVDLTRRLHSLEGEPSLEKGWMQFLPGKGPWDGFFLAAMRRKEN